jgi:hypothetical protein
MGRNSIKAAQPLLWFARIQAQEQAGRSPPVKMLNPFLLAFHCPFQYHHA